MSQEYKEIDRNIMKNFLLTFIFTIVFFSFNIEKEPDLFSKIANQELIKKSDFEKLLNRKFSNYQENMYGSGMIGSVGDINVGVVRGRRNDTVFDILVAFENSDYFLVKEHPNSTFYPCQNGAFCTEYELGGIYVAYQLIDTTSYLLNMFCISCNIITKKPVKVDTMTNMYRGQFDEIIRKDAIEFCSYKK